jgi:N-acetylglucosaminyl-diphospho-decaprenol L-rhamnosyltransferase
VPTSQVDVVIVGYKSVDVIDAAIGCLRRDPLVRGVVLVDNDSGDGTAERGRALGTTVVETGANLGFAKAVNIGLDVSDAPYVLMLNPDAEMEPGALGSLVDVLEREPRAAMVSTLVLLADGTVGNVCRRFSTLANRILPDVPLLGPLAGVRPEYDASLFERSEPIQEVDWVAAASLLVRRSFLDEIGGLDERFFLYSEDEDLCWQARARGYSRLLHLGAVAHHAVGHSTGTSWWLTVPLLVTSQRQLFEKWHGRGTAALYDAGIRAVMWAQAASATIARRPVASERAELARLVSKAMREDRVRRRDAGEGSLAAPDALGDASER